MKATVYGLLAAVVGLVVLAIPMKALAREHHGWAHGSGNHWGSYHHQGGYAYSTSTARLTPMAIGGYASSGNPGLLHHLEHDWYEHHGYGGNGYGYNTYPGNYGYGGYPGAYSYPSSYSYPGYGYGGYPGGYGSVPSASLPCTAGLGYGAGSYYGSGYAPNVGKLMQLDQTMSQRLYANQGLYQAAMAQGNYGLANKAAYRMQNQSATISAANAMLGGAAAPGYRPAYGMNPYCGQAGISPLVSPLGSMLHMFGY